MPKREVDKRKTRKALRKLRRAAERATGEGGPGLTDWEKDFVEGVSGRLERYGSAFRDPGKGRLEEALSQRQTEVARIIDRKSRRKKTSEPDKAGGSPLKRSILKHPTPKRPPLKRKTPMRSRPGPRVRDVNEDPDAQDGAPARKRARLYVIRGGKEG